MQPTEETYDSDARAREKQASREQDERDLRSGRKSVEQLCRENEWLGSLARFARVDIESSGFPE